MKESSGEFLEEYRDFNIFKGTMSKSSSDRSPIEYWLEARGDGIVLNDLNAGLGPDSGKEMGFVKEAKIAIDEYWTYSMVNQRI